MSTQTQEQLEQRVLILAPTGRDGPLTCEILTEAGFAAQVCGGMEQLCDEFGSGVGAVVIAEEALVHNNAACLLDALKGGAAWSDPPVILLTGHSAADATHRLASTLGMRANLMLLERPLRKMTLTAAVASALRGRRRQYQARELLRQREKAVHERDRFLAILGHELRNPLAAILTTLAAAESEMTRRLEPAEQDVIARQTRHLSRLIDDLLDVSRVTAGKITLQMLPANLDEVARRSIESLQPAIRAHGHTVTLIPAAAPAYVLGDPARLEQIFTNLVNNAVKYTPEGGQIDVSVKAEAGEARFSVRDNGIGIPESALLQIFEPFTQVEQSLHRSQGGLGLGLSLVQKLVTMQHGTVTAHSGGEGQGSEFRVAFPLIAAPAATAPATANPAAKRQRRVLLVEDSDDARRAMQRLLRNWGHAVEVAADGPGGVARALDTRPEVALVDIGMPGMDGYEVARRLRSELAGRIYLIALTGYGQPGDRQRTADAGFDLHLVKPVEPAQLRTLLESSCLPPEQ